MLSVQIGHARVNPLSFVEALEYIVSAAERGDAALVVTPNIHHIAELESNPAFRAAYESASWQLADGWPVALIAGVLTRRRVQRVTGADLVPQLVTRAAEEHLQVVVLGGAPGTEALLRKKLHDLGDDTSPCKVHVIQPPFGFDQDHQVLSRLVQELKYFRPSIVLVGLGAPLQEVLAHRLLVAGCHTVFVCVGAGIDFLSGRSRRAPRWIQTAGMEWLWRLIHEPRRLGYRYFKATIGLSRAVARQVIRNNKERT